MVVLHVKSSISSFSSSSSSLEKEEMEFLHECATTIAVTDVAAVLAGTSDLQARILSLCRRLQERCADASEFGRALSEAKAYASKQYPDDKLESVQLWGAGKELDMDKKLCDYIGANEKTKDLFLVTIDTVSSAIEWAMVELLENPHTMKILQDEFKSIIGSKTNVEYADIDRLPYLQVVVRETLRLHSVLPFIPNKAEADVEIQGYTIPKGCTVLVNVWAVHQNGPEVNKFIPDRFLGKDVDFLGMNFEFIPFSAGRRICLGLPLVNRALHAMLGSLVHRFE